MRNTALFILIVLILVLFSPTPGNCCSDLLEIFLSKEKISNDFKDKILDVARELGRAEALLHGKDIQGNKKEFVAVIDTAVSKWFDFYSKYAKNPPAQWISNNSWLEKLSVITKLLAVLRNQSGKLDYDTLHPSFLSINETLLSIFKSRKNISEQTLISAINKKFKEITSSSPDEFAENFNNLKMLTITLKDYDHKELTGKKKEEYNSVKSRFISSIESIDPGTQGTASVILQKPLEFFKKYQEIRTTILQKDWFSK